MTKPSSQISRLASLYLLGGVKGEDSLLHDRRGQNCSLTQPGHLCVCSFFSPSLPALLRGRRCGSESTCQCMYLQQMLHVCTSVCFSLVFLCVYLCFSACACVYSQHAPVSSLPHCLPKVQTIQWNFWAWSLGGECLGGGLLRVLLTLHSAGNAVILKPSEVSGHMADQLATLVPQYLDQVRCSQELRGDCVGGQVFTSRETVDYIANGMEPLC